MSLIQTLFLRWHFNSTFGFSVPTNMGADWHSMTSRIIAAEKQRKWNMIIHFQYCNNDLFRLVSGSDVSLATVSWLKQTQRGLFDDSKGSIKTILCYCRETCAWISISSRWKYATWHRNEMCLIKLFFFLPELSIFMFLCYTLCFEIHFEEFNQSVGDVKQNDYCVIWWEQFHHSI